MASLKVFFRQKKIILIFLTIILILVFFFSFALIQKSKKTNIIFITLDALRFDHLGCYGYQRNTSPNIDKLAQEGVMFTQAITHAPLTVPSVISMITSTHPFSHGVYKWGMC